LRKSPSSLVPFHSLFTLQVPGKGAEQKKTKQNLPFLFCGLENLGEQNFSISLLRAREFGRTKIFFLFSSASKRIWEKRKVIKSAHVPSTGAQNLLFFLCFLLLLYQARRI